MTWRLAKSLETLRAEINALHPGRSKVSDGTIGNAEHASRSSDHNPWVMDGKTGVVTAMDITHDPAHGVDTYALAKRLVANPDIRLKYVISNGQIASREKGWSWRKYTGKNPHNHHVHISVMSSKALYDGITPWGLTSIAPPQPQAAPVEGKNPVLTLGTKGEAVERLQRLLGVTPDADFGPKTYAAIKAFQKSRKMVVDGIVGAETWGALGA